MVGGMGGENVAANYAHVSIRYHGDEHLFLAYYEIQCCDLHRSLSSPLPEEPLRTLTQTQASKPPCITNQNLSNGSRPPCPEATQNTSDRRIPVKFDESGVIPPHWFTSSGSNPMAWLVSRPQDFHRVICHSD